MMMQFQKEHPQVDFQLFNGDYHDIDTWLGDGSVDLAFTTLPARPGCRCTPLYEDALAAVLPKGHPLGQSPVCRVEELAKEPFISLLESSNHDVRRAFHAVKAAATQTAWRSAPSTRPPAAPLLLPLRPMPLPPPASRTSQSTGSERTHKKPGRCGFAAARSIYFRLSRASI